MTTDADYGAPQLEVAIGNALATGDVEAAVDLLRWLVAVDAERAELVYQTMRVGIAMASPNDSSRP